MKLFIIFLICIALIIVFYAFYLSFKMLRDVQKQSKENPILNNESTKLRHPKIDQELQQLAKQRDKLSRKK